MRVLKAVNQRLVEAGVDVRTSLIRGVSSWWVPVKWRPGLLGRFGFDVHPSVLVGNGVALHGRDLSVGPGTFFIGPGEVDATGGVTIGRNVAIGGEIMISTARHDIESPERRMGAIRHAAVVVGDGCWVNARVTILSGVTVGSGCILLSGAVVTSDCAPNGMYGGVPAKRIRELDP